MKTVGSILKKARQEKELSLDEIEQEIKIRKSYLAALEESDYSQLPSSVFIKGFIRTYAQFLGLKPDEVIAFWRREYDQKENTKASLTPPQPLKKERIIITPGLLIAVLSGIGVIAFLIYIYSQYSSFALSPVLIIDRPPNEERLKVPFTEVVGRTDPEAIVTINGQEIRTTESGAFDVNIDLISGKNTIEVVSTNKLGRKTTERRQVIVENGGEPITPPETSSAVKVYNGVEVMVTASPEAAWIRVDQDGTTVYEGVLSAGAQRTFTATSVVKIRTGKANSTRISVNGKDKGIMGSTPDPVEREYQKE